MRREHRTRSSRASRLCAAAALLASAVAGACANSGKQSPGGGSGGGGGSGSSGAGGTTGGSSGAAGGSSSGGGAGGRDGIGDGGGTTDAPATDAAPATDTAAERAATDATGERAGDAGGAPVLAAIPPMGWNSWNTFQCNMSETLIQAVADAFVSSGMQAAGYQYVNLDDCWMDGRDASGNLKWNTQ